MLDSGVMSAVITGAAAFLGAGLAVTLKYWADHRLMERENLRRKTESLARHLTSLATLVPLVQSVTLAPEDIYGSQSLLEHLQDARGDCCGIDMYGTSQVRALSKMVVLLLKRPEWHSLENTCEKTLTELAAQAEEYAVAAMEAWRSGEQPRGKWRGVFNRKLERSTR